MTITSRKISFFVFCDCFLEFFCRNLHWIRMRHLDTGLVLGGRNAGRRALESSLEMSMVEMGVKSRGQGRCINFGESEELGARGGF